MIDRDLILYQKRRADEFKLSGRLLALKYSPSELTQIYNGIGGELQPLILREIVTATHPDLATAAFIHDIEWHLTEHTPEAFLKSNKRFLLNGLKIIKKKYGKYDPRRYIGITQANLMYKLLLNFGYDAYKGYCKCDFCKGKST